MEKILSIFIDESGDFGKYDKHAPYYFVTMLFHDQSASIGEELSRLDGHLSMRGLQDHCLHTAPLIRRESPYQYWTIDERKQLLSSFMNFAAKVPFTYAVFAVEKEERMNEFQLIGALSKKIKDFLDVHAAFFGGFDQLIIYYDSGQKQLTGILASLLLDANVDFRRKIKPANYRLFQIADLLTTFELIEYKRKRGANSASEQDFFGSMHDFYKNYYKRFAKRKISCETH